jgi:hypothetical protein
VAILREASSGGSGREEGSLKTDRTVEGLSKACYDMIDAVRNVCKTGRSAVAMCSVDSGHNGGGGGGGGGIRWLHWFHLAVIVSLILASLVCSCILGRDAMVHIASILFLVAFVMSPRSTRHQYRSWSSFELWPMVTTVAVWIAYGVLIHSSVEYEHSASPSSSSSTIEGGHAITHGGGGDGHLSSPSYGSTGTVGLFSIIGTCCVIFLHSRFIYSPYANASSVHNVSGNTRHGSIV